MWILFTAGLPILLFCLSHAASCHMDDSFGSTQTLYFDLHPCVNDLNGFPGLCDWSQHEESVWIKVLACTHLCLWK